MLYLSPVWHSLTESNRNHFGYMLSVHTRAGVGLGVASGRPWMLDNGAFSNKWAEDVWIGALHKWQAYAPTCIAAVCPDVVGDAAASLERFRQYAPIIRRHGYRLAFVTQDGLMLAAVPWSEFDVLFIGGSTDHKLCAAWEFIAEAKRRGKWVHIGRVNSARRIELFWMAESCDGTMLAREPSLERQSLLLNAARLATAKCRMEALL